MRFVYLSVLGLAIALAAHAADAQRGAELIRRERCLECHNIRGEGARTAPDLGRRTTQRYTPALLASVMWNHAPTMWQSMAAKGIEPPKLTSQDAGDLFAYFFSVRYFDYQGEAGRGKAVLEQKRCLDCHSDAGPGKPISQWTAFGDRVLLVQAMWVHAGQMSEEFRKRNRKWPTLTGQDLADLTVYLRNLPQASKAPMTFSIPDPATGKDLFESVCAPCHNGPMSLDRRLYNQTLTDIAADMWNHAPKMTTARAVGPEEMRRILAYVWQSQFLNPPGDAVRGEKAFTAKHCSSCHNDPQVAPKLPAAGQNYNAITMISVLWTHGPQMLQKMNQKGIAWPSLSAEDVANLAAFLSGH